MYIAGALAVLLGALGLYSRGQKYKIESLEKDISAAKSQMSALEKQAKAAKAKADLHKTVAKEVSTKSEVTRKRVQELQEKIDAIKDGEDFSITL